MPGRQSIPEFTGGRLDVGPCANRVVIGHGDCRRSGARRGRDERRRLERAVRDRGVQVQVDHAERRRPVFAAATLAPDERAILARKEIAGGRALAGELRENALPFRLLEAFAVALEEPVRAALAADADAAAPAGRRRSVVSSSVPAAKRPLAAPLKKRNVGCASSDGTSTSSCR